MQQLTKLITILSLGLAGVSSNRAEDETTTTSKWEKSAALGLTLTSGNSDTVLLTADVRAGRKWTADEINLGASGAYGENNSVKNNEQARAFSQWDHLFSDRFYSYARVEALHDAVADVEYRVTLSPGAGYHLIKREATRFSVEAGPALVFEKQGGVDKTYLSARLAEKFTHKLNDRAHIWESAEFLPQVDRVKNYIINSEIGVETALTKRTSLRAVVQDTFDNEPAPRRKKNDVKLVTSIAVKF